MLPQLWNYFTIGTPIADLTNCGKTSIIVICGIFIILQTILGSFTVDKRSSLFKSDLENIRKAFYFYAIFVPMLIFVNSLELLLVIMASSNDVTFTIALVILFASYVIKALVTEDGYYSIFGLTILIQKLAYKIIITEGYKFPLQSIIIPAILINRIGKKQRKHL